MNGAGLTTSPTNNVTPKRSDWPLVKLGEVLTQCKDYIDAPEPREYPKLSVKLYGRGVVLDAPADGTTLRMRRHQIARAGQVILSEIWGKKGAIGFVPPDGDGALCTSHFFLFEVNRERLTDGWLAAIFRANVLARQLETRAFGTTGYAAVRPKDLLACGIPLPPLPEQRRIVAKLDTLFAKVNAARSLQRPLLEATEALVTAEASKVFDALCHHRALSIRELGIGGNDPVQTGPFGAQLHASEFVSTGVPVLNVGNVWPTGLRLDRLDYVLPAKAAQLSRYEVRTGDLLFARSGATLGKVCLVPERCDGWLMTGHLFRVRFDPSLVFNRFAFTALRRSRSVRQQVFGQVRGATRPGFNSTLLGNVELPLPPLPVQERVVAHLDALESRVQDLQRTQERVGLELEALVPAILDRAFEGEL